MFEPELQTLYDDYLNVLKPLIAEYESQEEDIVPSLLENLPFMFDNIVSFSKTHKVEAKNTASQHLEQAISDVRVCLIGSMMENMRDFNNKYPTSVLLPLEKGQFYHEYKDLEKQVRACKDSDHEKTYSLLKEIMRKIEGVHDSSMIVNLIRDNRGTFFYKCIITIVFSIFVNWLILKLF